MTETLGKKVKFTPETKSQKCRVPRIIQQGKRMVQAGNKGEKSSPACSQQPECCKSIIFVHSIFAENWSDSFLQFSLVGYGLDPFEYNITGQAFRQYPPKNKLMSNFRQVLSPLSFLYLPQTPCPNPALSVIATLMASAREMNVPARLGFLWSPPFFFSGPTTQEIPSHIADVRSFFIVHHGIQWLLSPRNTLKGMPRKNVLPDFQVFCSQVRVDTKLIMREYRI